MYGTPDFDSEGKVIMMPPRNNVIPLRKDTSVTPIQQQLPISEEAQKNYDKLLEKDPTFDGHGFLRGACRAFTKIVKDFAEGHKESLKKLLSETVYKQFSKAIDARHILKQTAEADVKEILEHSIEKIEFRGNRIYITVKFRSDQMTLTMDEEGKIIDNPARLSSKVTDIWTFSKEIDSQNPNWVLSATRTENEGER